MTSWVVADSGLFLATLLDEPLRLKARAILRDWNQQNIQIGVPYLFRYELVAVVRKHVYRGTITSQAGLKIRDALLRQPVQTFSDDTLLKRAYDLATMFNRPTVYDSQYLAVAEQLGCEFWTLDERLYNAVSQNLTWVKWLGNFQTET